MYILYNISTFSAPEYFSEIEKLHGFQHIKYFSYHITSFFR